MRKSKASGELERHAFPGKHKVSNNTISYKLQLPGSTTFEVLAYGINYGFAWGELQKAGLR